MEVVGTASAVPLIEVYWGNGNFLFQCSVEALLRGDLLQEVGDFRREVAQMRQREVAREEQLEDAQERLRQMQAELTAVKAAARANVSELERLRTVAGPMQEVCPCPLMP